MGALVVALTGDDGSALVVERAAEDLVAMPFKNLFTLPGLWVPQSCRLVRAGR